MRVKSSENKDDDDNNVPDLHRPMKIRPIDFTTQSHAQTHCIFDLFFIQTRQRSGMGERQNRGVCIRFTAKMHGIAAKCLAQSRKLNVNFKTNNRFVFFVSKKFSICPVFVQFQPQIIVFDAAHYISGGNA